MHLNTFSLASWKQPISNCDSRESLSYVRCCSSMNNHSVRKGYVTETLPAPSMPLSVLAPP